MPETVHATPVVPCCCSLANTPPATVVLANFSGPVVSILEGDTLEVLHNNHSEGIRLSRIDCPEKGQAFGLRAKQAASALDFGKEVTVQIYGHDKYRRTIGAVILPDEMESESGTQMSMMHPSSCVP